MSERVGEFETDLTVATVIDYPPYDELNSDPEIGT